MEHCTYNAGVAGSNPAPPHDAKDLVKAIFDDPEHANVRSSSREIQPKSNIRTKFSARLEGRETETQQIQREEEVARWTGLNPGQGSDSICADVICALRGPLSWFGAVLSC